MPSFSSIEKDVETERYFWDTIRRRWWQGMATEEDKIEEVLVGWEQGGCPEALCGSRQ